MKLSEPSNTGALKNAHEAFFFLEEVTGVAEAYKLTCSALYVVACKELLAAACPGGVPRQALRFSRALLAALEELVTNEASLVSFRMEENSDSRTIEDCDRTTARCQEGLTAKFTRSKTISNHESLETPA